MQQRERQSKIEKIRIDSLRPPSVGKAQRGFHPAKGDRLAAEFDINAFGFPVVCRVNGVLWLVDGQYRVYAIQKSGYAKASDEIECEVYEGLSLPEMANMFLRRNRSTLVTAFERFGVAVTAGYAEEVAIARIAEDLELKIAHPTCNGNIYAVAALRRVYDRNGPEVLRRALRILRDAYRGEPAGFARTVIDGLGLVLASYGRIDDEALVNALVAEPHGVHGLQRRADDYRERLGRSAPECIGASFVDIYNRRIGKKRQLVKWWKRNGDRLRQSPTR